MAATTIRSGGTQAVLRDRLPARVPLWREPFAVVEAVGLRLWPVYWGIGVPHGKGDAVVPVPGFMGTDDYLFEMRGWLKRIGYRPYRSEIGQNADCLDALSVRLIATLETAREETGRPAHLVGHSLGGILSRTVAILRPDLVASITTMGSPVRGVRSHPTVMKMGDRVKDRIQSSDQADPECFGGECRCAFVQAANSSFPEQVPEIAIYTKTDGVVEWRYSRHADPRRDIEVQGTHCGLAFNPMAYYHLARFLARNPSEPRVAA